MSKPKLVIDLAGADGNIFMVIAKARLIIPSEQLDGFISATLDAQRPGTHKTYEDMLALVNSYVELIDSSGIYPEYADEPVKTGGIDEAQVIAAIDRLNEHLAALPDTIPCSLEEIYPEFGVPDCGSEVYLALVEHELQTVEGRIGQAEEGQRALLEQLGTMLRECAAALRAAGVEPGLPDSQEEATGLPVVGEAGTGDGQG